MQALAQDFQLRTMLNGPMVAAASYDMETLHPWLQKRTGVDERLYKPVKDIVKTMQGVADMAQQAQMEQAAPQEPLVK